MRPIRGAAPGVSAADHWSAIRDNSKLARPANPSEAVATGDIHTPMPPSKAHLKRLARAGVGYREPESTYRKSVPPRIAFHRQLLRELGETMTIGPVNPPREPGVV